MGRHGIILNIRTRPREGRSSSPGKKILFIILVLLLLSPLSCRRGPSITAVSGKAVYRGMGLKEGMALEGVTIQVLRWQEGEWKSFTTTRSGYHGSFIVHLPEGRYLLTARTILMKSTGNLELKGKLEGLEITAKDRRVDRIVLELEPGGT